MLQHDQNPVVVTDHAHDRMKERLGLPKKAHQAAAQRALQYGTGHEQARGRFKRYLDRVWFDHPGSIPKIYGEHIYFFRDGNVLTTVYEVPKNMRAGVH
jgi:hypothetical protein